MNTEIEKLIKELDHTFKELFHIFSNIEEDQFNVIPFEGSWTAGQLAKHLEKSNKGFFKIITGPVKDPERAPDQLAQNIKADFLDFSYKATSPDFVLPPQAVYDKEELLNSLEALRKNIIEAVETLDITKLCLSFEIPYYGYLTRLESFIFVIYHTKRHIHQLKNILQKLNEIKNFS